MVTVNGTEMALSEKTIMGYLVSANYNAARVAVERNGEIVPKAQYEETILKDGDTLEIVSFVGGG